MQRAREIQQAAAGPFAALVGVHEQHLDLVAVQAHEAGDFAGIVFAYPYPHRGQVGIEHLRVHGLYFFFCQERMRGAHRTEPDVHQGQIVAVIAFSDVHFLIDSKGRMPSRSLAESGVLPLKS
ncbi:hypothetical protein D9M70_640300 [compost metagenome]